MSNEISFTGSLSAFKASAVASTIARSISGALFTWTGTTYVEGTLLVSTSATAIPLGSVTSPHWSYLHNLDASNYLTVANGAGGAVLCRLLAGEYFFAPLDPTAIPYVTANGAQLYMEYMILQS